ncbi:hypothetical protein [Streptomyces sp. NPDC006739]|uniref:hypothetical protein n=1 Tax=Streptomyces sp. NPDC006739 TaxID=3364763 RepID=UPI0036AC39F5
MPFHPARHARERRTTDQASYFLSKIDLRRGKAPTTAPWPKRLFIATSCITADAAEYLGLPRDRTVIMGSHIEVQTPRSSGDARLQRGQGGGDAGRRPGTVARETPAMPQTPRRGRAEKHGGPLDGARRRLGLDAVRACHPWHA